MNIRSLHNKNSKKKKIYGVQRREDAGDEAKT